MIYLATPPTEDRAALYRRHGIGVMLTPARWGRPDTTTYTAWAADTGCFTKPDSFDLGQYLAWLDPFPRDALFITAPDRLADPAATWTVAEPVLPLLRDHGFRAALVAQDGLTDPPWDEFDCLFIGGTTRWKLSEDAYRLADQACERNKWVHMGRVNSFRRLRAASLSLFDSADGNYTGFGPDVNLPKLIGWLQHLDTNRHLWSPTLGV